MPNTTTWDALVRALDPDIDKPAVAYELSNGREFLDPGVDPVTDKYTWAVDLPEGD